MGCLGWLLILAGIGSFFLSLGFAAPLSFGLLVLGLLFVLVGRSGKAHRTAESLSDEVVGLRDEVRRLRKERGR